MSKKQDVIKLPRDSHFRIASSPHVEHFRYSDKPGATAPMKVADFVMSPHPSPEEAPRLSHQPILSSDTKVIKHQLTPEEWAVARPRG